MCNYTNCTYGFCTGCGDLVCDPLTETSTSCPVDCAINLPFIENFDGAFNPSKWAALQGGAVYNYSSSCSSETTGSVAYLINKVGGRRMITGGMNVNGIDQVAVRFYINTDDSSCRIYSSSEFVTLEYSFDGGYSWNLLASYYGDYGVKELYINTTGIATPLSVGFFQRGVFTSASYGWLIDNFRVYVIAFGTQTYSSTWVPPTGNPTYVTVNTNPSTSNTFVYPTTTGSPATTAATTGSGTTSQGTSSATTGSSNTQSGSVTQNGTVSSSDNFTSSSQKVVAYIILSTLTLLL